VAGRVALTKEGLGDVCLGASAHLAVLDELGPEFPHLINVFVQLLVALGLRVRLRDRDWEGNEGDGR
jgi:hypothetical protein